MKNLFLLFALSVCALSTPPALAETIVVAPQDDWFFQLANADLVPGDELVFREGVYSDSRRLVVKHSGTAKQPIVIRAAEGERVIFRRPDAKQNSFNLEGTQFLVLAGFEITGGAAAIRIEPDGSGRQARNVTLESLHIHHVGGVAITCNAKGADYDNMVFRQNHIHHTSGHGEAFYLGANEAQASFHDSVIEDNYIHDLKGAKVDQGDGIEIKPGSFGNVISGNIIHDTNYPAITVYGTNGGQRNVIQNNLIWSTNDHGIQAAADAIIRKNFIADAGGCGIYSREHQGATPSNLRLEGNYVFSKNNPAVRLIGSNPNADEIELFNNMLFSRNLGLAVRVDVLERIDARNNRGVGTVTGSSQVLASWSEISSPQSLQMGLPKLENNPAWKTLRRSEVAERFRMGRN